MKPVNPVNPENPGESRSAELERKMAQGDCLHWQMLKELGFEHPCETHCLAYCCYVPDPHSFSAARICHINDGPRHVEIVPDAERLNKECFRSFRLWQIREKIIERNNPDKGVRDISFECFDECQKRKAELARRPKLNIGISTGACLRDIHNLSNLWEIAFDNGFMPVVAIT